MTTFSASVPQMRIDLDREKAMTLGVPVDEVFETLQSTFGALYVNDFNRSPVACIRCSCSPSRASARIPRTFATCTCARSRASSCR